MNIPLEEEEQIMLANWLNMKNIKFTAIPNSTFTTSWNQKRKNKAMGLNAGLPDLMIILPKKEPALIFIEMKRQKKSLSVVRKAQKEWINNLNTIENVQAEICYGAEEAINLIENMLK